MTGQLFTHYFLTEGIRETPEWRESVRTPEALAGFRTEAARRFASFSRFSNPNEAVTEEELIRPILRLLGWTDYLPQQEAARGEDVPDHLLFEDSGSKARAAERSIPDDRYLDALVVQESKRFGLPLDARDRSDRFVIGTPHGQILRYLATAYSVSDGRIGRGVLTNGRVWRLYDHQARPRANGYFEADLGAILERGDEDDLRTFLLLFRCGAFVLPEGARASFIDTAIAGGKRYEEGAAEDLSQVVFGDAFPRLLNALAAQAPEADLQEVRGAALIFLYRLLFVLYAEDRGLLPVNDLKYDDYGLRPVRDDIAARSRARDAFSSTAGNYYNRLMELFRQIDGGDRSIGLPPYNGGLFAEEAATLLTKVRLPDSEMAPVVFGLSHVGQANGGRARFVNYRDMTVQQLGSLYERLLEREPVHDSAGNVSVQLNRFARKDSGSFYTSQELVDLIVERTLKPLAEERLRVFEATAENLKSDRRAKDDRLAELVRMDPAEAVLDLKVLDPAMGSGHFLVTAVDFLSDYVAELIEYVPAVADWLEEPYESPLVGRITQIRQGILERAAESEWVIDEAQLTDQAIIRRMVLKRCIYGVDKNRLTVELAKVSLWLHSFTVGAPLSFLDHHLRCGDSLVGLRVGDGTDELRRLGGLIASSAIQGAENAVAGMELIEEMSDADVAEVRESARLFEGVDQATAELRRVLDFLQSLRWLTAGMKKRQRAEFETRGLLELIGAYPAKAYPLLADGPEAIEATSTRPDDAGLSRFAEIWRDARALAEREGFLHWEVAFPGVWRHWQRRRPEGGFDAVIGNPPWDRIKLQEVEWFATRDPELARAPTAALRRKGIKELRDRGDSLAAAFDEAKERADSLLAMFRESNQYPLLGRGDINLYSLFVERALDVLKPGGLVGLLVPSGICADRTAAPFFRSMSTSGRVAGLFDFENRRLGTGLPPFFPDVDTRFKFCALIVGGADRTFAETPCGFFLESADDLSDSERCFPLSPADFGRVNPNTGTAPVFRTRRDAEITKGIYERHPVLVDRSDGSERRAWPVRYKTMFHMTNDSHLFRTAAELEAAGCYPVAGNRWKRGEEEWLPLYEGKMVQAFDHRAASVIVNPENLNRPAQPREATLAEREDPRWSPDPQFWVAADEVDWPRGFEWALAFKDVTAPTNVRTMIAALIPRSGVGNTLPLLLADEAGSTAAGADALWLLAANFNSLVFDFVARQKVQGQHLNWFIVEQLPVIPAEDYARRFGDQTALEVVRDHLLRLAYTSHDMEPLARDLSCERPPLSWDQEGRRHLRARLDALYFLLYGLSREDAEYVLGTFPIVQRQDEVLFGSYRTSDLVLAYMNALTAGDVDTTVAL
ncbi:MAG: restriction endonuclease [Acidobacteriota bacterium]|nr:restriction endonuclease [Acidobacteriota bacterium]